jgi:hypothetical protein
LVLYRRVLAHLDQELQYVEDHVDEIGAHLVLRSFIPEVIVDDFYEVLDVVDGDLDEVDAHVLGDAGLVELAEDVLLQILVVVLAEELEEAEDLLEDLADLLLLLGDLQFVGEAVGDIELLLPAVVLAVVVVEVDALQAVLDDLLYVLEDYVLVVPLEDPQELLLVLLVAALQQLVPQLEHLYEQVVRLAELLLEDCRNQFRSAEPNQCFLMQFQRSTIVRPLTG